MKAIRVHKFGGPEVLALEDVEPLSPREGEALVRLRVAGVNFIDTYHRSGQYPVQLPFTPGVEGAGVVVATGSGVTSVKAGDRVAYAMTPGSYAEEAIVPAWKLVPLPPGLDYERAAASMVQGMTAHYLTRAIFPLEKGHRALVHAAAGGVGLLLVQIAKILGAEVIGTVSTPDKAELARSAGADHVILYSRDDFLKEALAITEGKGVDVVYESVGKATFDRSLQCLKPRGYLILFGQSSGAVPSFDPQLLNQHGSLFLTRPSLHHYVADRQELLLRSREVFSWIEQGRLNVRIDSTFPLLQAEQAHRKLEARETTGKVLLLNES